MVRCRSFALKPGLGPAPTQFMAKSSFPAVRWAVGALVAWGCAGPPAPAHGPGRSASERTIRAAVPRAAAAPDTASTTPSASAHAEEEQHVVTDGDARAHPLAQLSDAEIEERLLADRDALGSMSLGTPSSGGLFAAERLDCGELCTLVDPENAWATRETRDGLLRALNAVRDRFGSSPPLFVGHISARTGGALAPHTSHQSGRDVDISYFYETGARWYARAHAKNLDRARTWEFVKALVVNADIDLILIDQSIQNLLFDYAATHGEDAEYLRGLFYGAPGVRRIVRHAPGHATHLHVRFFNPIAQETGRRLYALLVKHGFVRPIAAFRVHRAKRGDTLGRLARRYHTTVAAIQRSNGLRGTRIRESKTYLIPVPGGYSPPAEPARVPPRRLPPELPPASDALPRAGVRQP